MGRDRGAHLVTAAERLFQSTRPVWGATQLGGQFDATVAFQSTRPVWGATGRLPKRQVSRRFQSTRPVWGATAADMLHGKALHVSIHAPRVGRDVEFFFDFGGLFRFNPRAPCGARPFVGGFSDAIAAFQSTRPVWGATTFNIVADGITLVSIHAPRVGRDALELELPAPVHVSIHAPRVGRDGNWSHDFPLLPRIYGHSPPQIRFSRHLRPTPLLRHDSRTYIFTFCFLFTSPSHSVMNAQMMIAASKS